MAATRCGSLPAARVGFAALRTFDGVASFALDPAGFFLADLFFFGFVAMGAKTIAWRKALRAACGRLSRGGYANSFPQARVPRRFSLAQGSKTLDRSQILPRLLGTPEFRRPRGP